MGAREVATFDCSADKSEAVQFTPFPQLEMGQGSPLRSGSISVSRRPHCFTQSSRELSFGADAAFCSQGPPGAMAITLLHVR